MGQSGAVRGCGRSRSGQRRLRPAPDSLTLAAPAGPTGPRSASLCLRRRGRDQGADDASDADRRPARPHHPAAERRKPTVAWALRVNIHTYRPGRAPKRPTVSLRGSTPTGVPAQQDGTNVGRIAKRAVVVTAAL